jgi:hypothetical protein
MAVTEETFSTIKKIKFEWTSAADGTASESTVNVFTGEILRLVTIPGADADQPTDQYDITVADEDSTDVLMGAGANRSNANTEQVVSTSLGCVANDKLTINVSNAGNVKKGTAILYVRG